MVWLSWMEFWEWAHVHTCPNKDENLFHTKFHCILSCTFPLQINRTPFIRSKFCSHGDFNNAYLSSTIQGIYRGDMHHHSWCINLAVNADRNASDFLHVLHRPVYCNISLAKPWHRRIFAFSRCHFLWCVLLASTREQVGGQLHFHACKAMLHLQHFYNSDVTSHVTWVAIVNLGVLTVHHLPVNWQCSQGYRKSHNHTQLCFCTAGVVLVPGF